MCGISGYFKNNPDKIKDFKKDEISKILFHRGPDNFGYYKEDNLYLFHYRLSIIDLSNHGNQPMYSYCKRYTITFNGEIYNFHEIKKQIDNKIKINWEGNSDTEILINAISIFGLEKTLQKVRGMFAFVVWDKLEKKLLLVRDRVGQKPLYYGLIDGNFIFSSELKFFNEILLSKPNLNLQSASLMIEYGYVPTPLSIYKNINKLEQGGIVEFSVKNNKIKKIKWWTKNTIYSLHDDFKNNYDLDNLLTKSVKEQMISDVPIGAFLSGGLDSSLIVSILQKLSSKPVKTFTVGFDQIEYNESEKAKNIAKFLGTDHHEITFSNYDLKDILSNISYSFDEPFADSSQIPTILVSKFASDFVKVTLSGDGGDELFGGYNRYIWLQKIRYLFKYLPKKLRILISLIIKNLNNIHTYKLINSIFNFLITNPSNKLNKINQILNSNSDWDAYNNLISQWNNDLPFSDNFIKDDLIAKRFKHISNNSSIQSLMDFDFENYLCDDILVKLDRSSMASSLESRVPFLDERVIEYALKMPFEDKIYKNKGKIPIRKLLNKYLPNKLVNYPKQGFGVPIHSLLRNELKSWAEEIILDNRTYSQNFLDRNKIEKIWKLHQDGINHEYSIWTIIMFATWKDKWL